MSHSYIEVIYDSRESEDRYGYFRQTIVFKACLDETIEPEFPSYAFPPTEPGGTTQWNQVDDMVAIEYFKTILPPNRQLVSSFSQAPSSPQGAIFLFLDSINVRQTGPKEWEATATYLYDRDLGFGGRDFNTDNVVPYVKRSFTIGGEKKRIYKALEVIVTELPSNPPFVGAQPDDLEGALGIGKDGAEGVDVPAANMKLQITGYYKPEIVDPAFEKVIVDTIAGPSGQGSTNDAPFAGYGIREVQLLSASGGAIINGILPITFEFNITRTIIDATDINFPNFGTVYGSDYVEYTFRVQQRDQIKAYLMLPSQRRVLRLFDVIDYSVLKLPV